MRRVGVHVDQRAVHVVVVEQHRIVWSAAAQLDVDHPVTDNAAIAATVGELLDGVPKYRWPKLRVDVAIGAPWGRVKLVRGIPSVKRHKEVVAVLRLNTNRFIASTRPVIVTGAAAASDDEYHVGIAELGMIETVVAEVNKHNLPIGRIVPADSVVTELSRGHPADTPDEAAAGTTGETIAAGAAMGRAPAQLALRAGDNPATVRQDSGRRRVAIAATAFLLAVTSYFVVREHIDRTTLTRNQIALHALRMSSDSGSQENAELGRISRDLASAAQFSRHRTSSALVLGAITQALPAEATITTLRIDTTNVDMVVLSPRTADVVDAMSEVANVVAPTIIGPVSREVVGARELERATIRVHMQPDYDRAKRDLEPQRDEDP